MEETTGILTFGHKYRDAFTRPWRWLIEPTNSVQDVALRRKTRLLSTLLLIIIAVFVGLTVTNFITVPDYTIPWSAAGGYILLSSAYALSRTKYYSLAAGLTVSIFPVGVFALIVSGASDNPAVTLSFQLLGLLLACILLSIRGTAVLALANLLTILLLSQLAPAAFPDRMTIITSAVANIIASALAVVSMHHRNRAETERQAALRDSEGRYRVISELTSDFAYSVRVEPDSTLVVEWVTEAHTRITGYSPSEAMEAGDWESLVHPDDLPIALQHLQTVLTGQPDVSEYRIVTKSGETRWLRNHARPVWDESQDRVVRIHAAAQDITERKQVEKALEQYNKRLETLHELDQAILAVHSPEEIALAALGHLRQLVPCQRACVVSFDFEANEAMWLATDVSGETKFGTGVRLPLEGIPDVEPMRQGKANVVEDVLTLSQPASAVQSLKAEGMRSYVSVPLIAQDGLIGALYLWADSPGTFVPEHVNIAREVAGTVAVALQQARLLERVRAGRERLRALSRRLVEVQETERRQLARELHDRVGQSLTALSINLNILRSQLPAESAAETEARLEESLWLLEETAEHIRDVMAELHPAVLDDYGLEASLRWYLERFSERTGLATKVIGEELAPRLPPAVETALYRIAQEALTNVARHAEASQVTVALQHVNGEARLTIADDGKGFDPTALRQPGTQPGWGLITMRERAAGAGGHLRVESTPGEGTRVVVQIAR